jgi:VanZ family protein
MIEEEKLQAGPHIVGDSFDSGNRLRRYGPLILWAALIFIGSSDILSSSHTSTFLVRPLHWLFPAASSSTLAILHFSVRKLGHLTEYAILAVFAARAFRTSSRDFLRRTWFLISLLFVVVYALSDEFHQSFVPSRGASILDSMIDSLGGLIALTVLIFRGRVQKSRVSTARGSERIQTNS